MKNKKVININIKAVWVLVALLVVFSVPAGGRNSVTADGTSGEFELREVKPSIFTPESPDSDINTVEFRFVNPNYNEVTIRIYNIEGRRVRRNLDRSAEDENIMYWDGTDSNDGLAPAGIYIYSAESEGKFFTGLIGIAK